MISATKARALSRSEAYIKKWLKERDKELTDAIIEAAEEGKYEIKGKAIVVPQKIERTEACLALEEIK